MDFTCLADQSYNELSLPNDESVPSIVFWYESNLGQLNNRLGSSFSISANEVSPDLTLAEQVIYKYLFAISYFRRQIQKNLGAGAYGSSILEVKEGGTTIRRINRTDIAKQLMVLVEDLKEQLNDNVYAYNSNASLPYSIDVANPIIQEAFWLGCEWPSRVWP